MSNMSYCRYQNTLTDLEDCSEAMFNETQEDIDEMDSDELFARNRLIDVCQEIVGNFEVRDATEDEEDE